jgi:hypothetical protein
MRHSKPVTISEELAAKYTNNDQHEKFDNALRHILSVPHSVIVERELEYKRRATLNPNRRGPKPKRKSGDHGPGALPAS